MTGQRARLWRSGVSRRRLLWRGHDALYVAAGRWRLRIMKPGHRC